MPQQISQRPAPWPRVSPAKGFVWNEFKQLLNGKPDTATKGDFGIAIDPDGKPITKQGAGIDFGGKARVAREAGVQIDGNGQK